jgi:hypothetical protein
MPRGENFKGKKPVGSGVQKGQKTTPTKIKEEIRKEVIQTAKERYAEVLEAMLPKIQISQLALGLGAVKVFSKVPYNDGVGGQKSKLKILENDEEIIDVLSDPKLMQNTDFFIVQQKDPVHNSQAYMLDRYLGKDTEKIEVTTNNDNNLDLSKLTITELKTYLELEKKAKKDNE